jgi:nucleoid DNA-binding protein
VKIGSYIHELLKENETVIIPGFGAFLLEYEPAEIGETEIKPPSKIISFSSSIRNNDGLLVGHVANIEKISHFDAMKLIEKERDKIVFMLDKGEEVILEGTGQLVPNEKNEIVFTPVVDENLSLETFGLDAISIEKLKEEPSDEMILESSSSDEHHHDSSESQQTDEVTVSQEERSDNTVDKVAGVEESETKIGAIEQEEHNNDTDEEKSEPEMATTVFTTLEPEPEKREKKKSVWYLYLLILIPIIIAGVFIFNNLNEKKPELTELKGDDIQQNRSDDIQQNQSEIYVDSSLLIREEVASVDSVKAEHVEYIAEIDTISEEKNYYLIGGSFKEEDNAKDYMEELREKGFEPFYMGKRGNFYMVGVGKYATEGQAVRAREDFWEINPGAGLWVMEE